MKTRSFSAFKYPYRAPGRGVEGPISGHRWGVDRKRALLVEERA